VNIIAFNERRSAYHRKQKIRLAQVRFNRVLHPARVRRQPANLMMPSIESDAPMLRSYTQLKLRIAANLRGLREILHRRGEGARLRYCKELMVKLAENRFTIAVLVQFNLDSTRPRLLFSPYRTPTYRR
jgi:hypothetical protein